MPIEQRAALKLLGAAPPIPSRPIGPSRPEKRRRQILLNAQDGLAETAAWTREIMTPAASVDKKQVGVSTRSSLCASLLNWQKHGEAAITAEQEAHTAEVSKVRDGAARLAADLSRLKKANADGVGGGEAVHAFKRDHDEAFPDVRLMFAPAAVALAPKSSTTTAAAAQSLMPTGALLSL